MKLTDVKYWLETHNVPDCYYVINNLGCGEADGIGFINDQWCTYYSERGKYRNIKPYPSEDEACHAFAERIRRVMASAEGVNLPPP